MRITLLKSQANNVKLDIYPNFVRAAFYLGYSLTYIEEMVQGDAYADERSAMIQLATTLGMSDIDTVEISK